MLLLAPLALLALVPWAILAWWLLRAPTQRTGVPFIHLWPQQPASRRGARRLPPGFVLWALAGLLLAILAASRPAVPAARGETGLLLVIDRGASMSAGLNGTRLASFGRDHPDLLASLGRARLQVISVPPSPADGTFSAHEWPRPTIEAHPSAAPTAPELRRIIREATADARPVLVITDQAIPRSPEVFRAGPRDAVASVGITRVVVEAGEALVTLQNTGPADSAILTLTGETGQAQHQVSLLPGEPRQPALTDLVLPLPGNGRTDWLFVQLQAAPDAWPGDRRFAIARTHAWPELITGPGASPAVARLAEVYAQDRPPRPHSRRLRIDADPAADVILLPPGAASEPVGDWQILDHAVTRGVDWHSLADVVVSDADEPGPGWEVLVRLGGHALLAVHEGPPRRAWVGFASRELEQTPAFVRFWADLITWVNAGPERWGWQELSGQELAALSLEEALERIGIEPGPVAWNLPPVDFGTSEWDDEALDQWLRGLRPRVPLTPWLAAAALAALAMAAWRWPRRPGGGGEPGPLSDAA